jgi:hypothetical protein
MVDLKEAGARLRDYRPEPTPDVSEILGRRDRRRRRRIAVRSSGAAVIAAAGIALALVLAPTPGAHQVVTSPTGTSGSLQPTSPSISAAPGKAIVTISLDRTTVPAGTPIQGVATVDNRTGAPIAIPGGTCNGWLFVGISNARIFYSEFNGDVGCAAFNVPVAVSRYPITIGTTYQTCTQTPAQATYTMPACLTHGGRVSIPPLPTGSYHSTVLITIGRGLAPITVANTVTVTLIPPGSAVTSRSGSIKATTVGPSPCTTGQLTFSMNTNMGSDPSSSYVGAVVFVRDISSSPCVISGAIAVTAEQDWLPLTNAGPDPIVPPVSSDRTIQPRGSAVGQIFVRSPLCGSTYLFNLAGTSTLAGSVTATKPWCVNAGPKPVLTSTAYQVSGTNR